MRTEYFIMAAGNAYRFAGTEKHNIKVGDETLLHRTDRLIGPGIAHYVSKSSVYCGATLAHSILYSLKFTAADKKVILLGDVFYSRNIIEKIKKTDDYRIFMRHQSDSLIGKTWSERYALVVPKEFIDDAVRTFQKICNKIENNDPLSGSLKEFAEIDPFVSFEQIGRDDITDDIDTAKDHAVLLEYLLTNKIEAKKC